MTASKPTPRQVSPQVYRRRRIVALVALVLVIALVWWLVSLIIGLFSGSEDEAGTKPQAVPGTSQSPTPEATTAPRACEPTEINLAVVLPDNVVKLGAPTAFQVTWTNVGEVACVMDGGWGKTNVHIVSGNDDIFNSVHCATESVDLFLAAGETYTRDYIWDQTRSNTECGAAQKISRGGTYRITAELAGVASLEMPFVIE